ncbi:MAG: ATP-binding protein [Anaerolineae bacterium]|jgi:CheY-like chemotaxis protein
MLDFSRRTRIKPRPLDLATLTEDLLALLEQTIPANIQVAYEVQGSDPSAFTVEADAGRIQQALTNLVLNARDAMPEGGDLQVGLSRVRITEYQRPPVADMTPGEWVCLAVRDTGIGMSKDVQAHLFEPFFTTKDVHEGTGLGLAQVYGIVRQHQGHIGVESEPGQGTTFRIYLAANGGTWEEQAGDGAADSPQGRGETVLLVEDQPRFREAGGALLESLGYRVVTAATGREALVRCEELRALEGRAQPVDLVVTDLVMPDLGGEDLLRELHRTMPGVKVLAMTGYSMRGDDQQALRNAGFLDVILKPVDVDGLAQAVRQALHA